MKTIEDLRHASEHTRTRLKLSLAVTRELKANSAVQAVYLVGGVAKGTANKFSDTDVLVEVCREDNILSVIRLAGKIADRLSPFKIHAFQDTADRANLFDVTVVTHERFQHPSRYSKGTYIQSLKNNAIPLYQIPRRSVFREILQKILPQR